MENIREDILEIEKDTVSALSLLIRFWKWYFEKRTFYVTRSRRRFIIFTLFMAVIILLIMTTPVLCNFPYSDYSKMIQISELIENNGANDKSFCFIFNSNDNKLLHLIGVYDQTKQYITIYGFSCSYQNYIRSTSFKFT